MELGELLAEFTKEDLYRAGANLVYMKWPEPPERLFVPEPSQHRRYPINTYAHSDDNKDDFIQYFEYRIAGDLLVNGRREPRWLSNTLNSGTLTSMNETDIKIEDVTHKAFAIFFSAFPTQSLKTIAKKLGVGISTDLPDRQSFWWGGQNPQKLTWNLEQGMVGSRFQYRNAENPYHWFVVSKLAEFVGDDTRYTEPFEPTFEHNKEKVSYCSDCRELKSMESNNCISCGKALQPIECERCGFVNRPLAKTCIGHYYSYLWDGTVCHLSRRWRPTIE